MFVTVAFDRFIWIARGMSLPRRVRHLEERWAYYFAFGGPRRCSCRQCPYSLITVREIGLPSAALCMWGSSLANAALFALIFPAVRPRPVPVIHLPILTHP